MTEIELRVEKLASELAAGLGIQIRTLVLLIKDSRSRHA